MQEVQSVQVLDNLLGDVGMAIEKCLTLRTSAGFQRCLVLLQRLRDASLFRLVCWQCGRKYARVCWIHRQSPGEKRGPTRIGLRPGSLHSPGGFLAAGSDQG